MGGKSRISKQISEVINNEIFRWQEQNKQRYSTNPEHTHTHFVSLFCGSCSIESKVNADIKILNDKHEYLIAMWQGLQNGYVLPDIITKEQYYDIKANQDRDKCLTGFVGFGCSFGGKWWGGLAANKKGDNYCSRANISVNKDLQGLLNAQFVCLNYKDVIIPDNSVVYADPPYKGTTGYTTGNFNHDEFWEYMRKISKDNIVFISEQIAPDDFECIWQKEFTRTLDVNKENQPKKIEKLFTYKKGKYYETIF